MRSVSKYYLMCNISKEKEDPQYMEIDKIVEIIGRDQEILAFFVLQMVEKGYVQEAKRIYYQNELELSQLLDQEFVNIIGKMEKNVEEVPEV